MLHVLLSRCLLFRYRTRPWPPHTKLQQTSVLLFLPLFSPLNLFISPTLCLSHTHPLSFSLSLSHTLSLLSLSVFLPLLHRIDKPSLLVRLYITYARRSLVLSRREIDLKYPPIRSMLLLYRYKRNIYSICNTRPGQI